MDSAAATVMGPRPGIAILKFWQGVVEIVLRVITIICGIATLIASAIAISQINSLPSDVLRTTDEMIQDLVDLNYRSMIFNSLSAGGTGVGVAVLFVIYEIVVIVLRFLNIGLINLKIKIFMGIDIVITFILAVIFGIAGILAAFMAVQWASLSDSTLLTLNFALRTGDAEALAKTRDVLAATAGTSLLGALFMSFLMTWTIFFLIQKWNDKVIKETLKSAV